MKIKLISTLIIGMLVSINSLQSYALSVTLKNYGAEIRYFSFHVEDGPIFYGDLKSDTETEVPGYIIKKLINNKIYVGGAGNRGVFSCGEINFKKDYYVVINVRDTQCWAEIQ